MVGFIYDLNFFQNNPLSAALNFFPFWLHFMLHCNSRKGMTCLHNNLVQSFSSSSTILLLISQVSKSSLSLSLSLSLNTHTYLNSKTHTKRLKLFTQYLQHNFSKFGQNHLLLDSSIDQYLPLRDWKASLFHKNSLVVIFLATCYKTIQHYTWFCSYLEIKSNELVALISLNVQI